MIEVLLLSSTFFIILFLGIVILTVNLKRWATRRDEMIVNKLHDLNKSIDETKALYKNEITNILNQLKNLLQ